MSVAEAQREISSPEFAEWMAYDQLEPMGEQRADLRMGIMAATLANVNRGRGQRAFKPADFMPQFEERQPTSPDVMWERAVAITTQHNKRFKK